ncbi:Ribosomal RNA large subunit methyltransferase H [Gammaproteobacteria bacterium]|nr:23S rRNA (pseudouridine(1915)-N(3))-methyltransferase RlmH [Gammaproteobacteria bacterium]CAG0940983.1 Ribosomal RNA large subunit methyltransferase H [Gammaproteobacteria bacterium]
MHITVAAVGTRLEPWVYDAFDAYKARLPRHLGLELEEVPLARRAAGTAVAVEAEGERLLRHVRPGALTLALDEHGRQWSSLELAGQLRLWLERQPRVAILVGGPDGLSTACRERADRIWSLSRLTFPHGMVRVLLAEQLYRAWTILQGHPYHRA